MSKLLPTTDATLPKERNLYNKLLGFILVLSAALFIIPAIAIILVLDAYAIGSGSAIAVNASIGAAIFCLLMPLFIGAGRKLSGPPSSRIHLLEKQIVNLQNEIADLRHQAIVMNESIEFTKQLTQSEAKSKALTEK
jgi:TolA-binding protein